MTTYFVTGDRALDPAAAVIAAMNVLASLTWKAVTEGSEVPRVATGDQPGFEAAVRYLLPTAQVFEAETGSDGKPDFDARHVLAALTCDKALVVHGEPFESNIYRSMIKYWADDALEVLP